MTINFENLLEMVLERIRVCQQNPQGTLLQKGFVDTCDTRPKDVVNFPSEKFGNKTK